MKQFPQGIFQTLDWLVKQVDRLKYQVSQLGGTPGGPGDPGGPGGGSSGITVSDEGTSLTTATSINFTGSGVTATNSGTDVTVTIPNGAPVIQIDLDSSDYTVTSPGIYRIINAQGGYNIIIDADPIDFTGDRIIFVNSTSQFAPIDVAGSAYSLYYNTVSSEVTQINGNSTYEFVSTYNSQSFSDKWISVSTTTEPVEAGNAGTGLILGCKLADGQIGLVPGVYVIDVASDDVCLYNWQLEFPGPGNYTGQRIVIINLDITYSIALTTMNGGVFPVTPDGTGISSIDPVTSMEFMSIGTNWVLINTKTDYIP